MAENNYKELVDFFGKQLERIHSEIAQVNTNLESKIISAKEEAIHHTDILIEETKQYTTDLIEETKRHTGILIEEVHHKLDLIIEGFQGIQEGRKRDNMNNEQEHERLDKRIIINTSDISSLGQRLKKLEVKA